MAQLRHDYNKFKALKAEVLVMVPNGPKMIARYTSQTNTPYPILTDKGAKVASEYMQIKKFFLAGTPAVFLVDKTGQIRFVHYATSLIEEPGNKEPLAVLAGLLG